MTEGKGRSQGKGSRASRGQEAALRWGRAPWARGGGVSFLVPGLREADPAPPDPSRRRRPLLTLPLLWGARLPAGWGVRRKRNQIQGLLLNLELATDCAWGLPWPPSELLALGGVNAAEPLAATVERARPLMASVESRPRAQSPGETGEEGGAGT